MQVTPASRPTKSISYHNRNTGHSHSLGRTCLVAKIINDIGNGWLHFRQVPEIGMTPDVGVFRRRIVMPCYDVDNAELA